MDFRLSQFNRIVVILVIFLSTFFSLPGSFAITSPSVQPLAPLGTDFVWLPKFIVIGDNVNFTALPSGGTPPYSFSWNFGDGQTGSGVKVLHAFNTGANYTVTVTVRDNASATSSMAHTVTVHSWPIKTFGWVVPWNITANDGINIWNVTYHGTLVIKDVRLAAVEVIYSSLPNGVPFCGPFYDEPYNETGVKLDGTMFYENSTNSFQLRAEYRVGGYHYEEIYRFYPTGRWDTELKIARGGCLYDHLYEPHWRFNLAVGNDTRNFFSTYTPSGSWQDLIWEGNYTENLPGDPSHNNAQWRFGNAGRYYYINQTIVRADLDLPYATSNMILVRARPNEIETFHVDQCFNPVTLIGDPAFCPTPMAFVNGELALRRDIAFWYIPRIWDHGPINGGPAKDITLSFSPYGAWP